MQQYLDSLPTELLLAIAIQNVNTWSWLPVAQEWCDEPIKQSIIDHYQTLTNLRAILGDMLDRKYAALLEARANDKNLRAQVESERRRQYDDFKVGDKVTVACNSGVRKEERFIVEKIENYLVLGKGLNDQQGVRFSSFSVFEVKWEGVEATKCWTICR